MELLRPILELGVVIPGLFCGLPRCLRCFVPPEA